MISFYGGSRKENRRKNKRRYFEDSTLLGLGTGLEWEGRNQGVNTTSGSYALGKVLLISRYTKWDMDIRHFWTEKGITTASRLVIGYISGETVPFALRYKLGSKTLLLGVTENRFNGVSQLIWQQEFRQPLLQVLDIVGFYEVGRVGSTLKFSNTHLSYGVGVLYRFKYSEQGLRLSLGFSQGNKRVNINFNHVF